ncbi:MAG: lytic transglycosylase domain-containing protein [Methylovirgula sp.]
MAALGGLGLCLAFAAATHPLRPSYDRAAATQLVAWVSDTLYSAATQIEGFFVAEHPRLASQSFGPSGPPLDRAAALGLDLSGLREALPFYKAGDLKDGDAQAAAATDPIVRATLKWVALRDAHDVGTQRLQAFLAAYPAWPGRDFILRRIEENLYTNHADPKLIETFFAQSPPQTLEGKLALARAYLSEGRTDEAQDLIRALWRNSDLAGGLESQVKAEFGSYLTKADHKARADRLLYEQDNEAGLRAAFYAGPEVVKLAKLRADVNNGAMSDKIFASVPAAMRSDPGYLFAKIQKLLRSDKDDKIKEAAALMLTAPRDPAVLVDGDAWWAERRAIARKLLDLNEPLTAYRICAEDSAQSNEAKIDAEFHAGWIALRFLNDPALAAPLFNAAAQIARTPISVARIAYWQGRTADAAGHHDGGSLARAYYERAAAQVATYYGQLAREHLGMNTIELRSLAPAATGSARDPSVRSVELLYALGENDLALGLAIEAAQHLTSEPQVAALANVVAAQRDAHASLVIGKILALRQMPVDRLAFPTYGIPQFEPLENSAPPPIVYAIARQESAFDPHAVSSAGAIGLMQMIESTAKRTAELTGVNFDASKLANDAAFNARLGAAHLGELFAEQGNSPILAFAAYNAGGRRVKEWIEAYGDPRTPGVDPIDWVERIPFEETRNYVQRVMENWAMYQACFGRAQTARFMLHTAAKL